MPNIVEYNAGTDVGLRPREGAISSTVQTGRARAAAMQSVGNDLGAGIATVGKAYQEQTTRSELSAGSASSVALTEKLTTEWNQLAATADPNDSTLAAKWRQDRLETDLAAWREQFTTPDSQLWADQQVAHLRQHFFEKTAADAATLQGEAVVTNLMTLKSRASNITLADPSAFNAVSGLIDNSIDAQIRAHPNLDPDAAARMRTELAQDFKAEAAKSAIVGAINANPAAGREAILNPAFRDYLDGTDIAQLQSYADTRERSNEAQARADKTEAERAQREEFQRAGAVLTGQLINPETGAISLPQDYFKRVLDLSLMPGSDPGQIRAMIDMGQQVTADGVKPVDDPAIYSNFSERMILPASDPNALNMTEVFQARAAGHLTDKSFNFFQEAVTMGDRDPARKEAYRQLENFFQEMKPSITRSNIFSGAIFPEQDQRFFQFQFDLHRAFDLRIHNGESPAAVANDLLDPRSPHYFGRVIPQYAIGTREGQAMMATSIRDGVGVVRPAGTPAPGAVPRKPGESPEAYLARTAGAHPAAPAHPAPHPAAPPAAPRPPLGDGAVDTSAGARQSARVPIRRH